MTPLTSNPDTQKEHSDIVGGSSAARIMACPGSYKMLAKIPAAVKAESSSFADEGTALHAAMQYILLNNVTDLENDILGRDFEGYVITREMLDEAIAPCVDFFDALDEEMQEEGGLDFLVECRCEMPGIPNTFGTSDLIARTKKRTIIVDWKFGVGVSVKAFYEAPGNKVVPNPQLMFYARAAMHSYPHMFERDDPDWRVDLHIAQPRGRDEGFRFTEKRTTVKDLETFRMELIRAVGEATSADAKLKRGDHCRFAKCKAICPHFTGPALDITKLHGALEKKKKGVLGGIDIDWSLMYGELLTLADLAEPYIAEIRAQAHAFAEEGHQIVDVDGKQLYKLVPKRPSEQYVDETGAVKMAMAHGVKAEDILTAPKTKSPAQLRAVLAEQMGGGTKKAREDAAKKMIAEFTKNVSSGTTLAPADDKRAEIISTSEVITSLSAKLAALTGR